jgi:predicted kinase
MAATMSNTTGQSSHQTRKLFIQMSGAPGSGKSTTATPLAKLINRVVIDHDILKSALLEKGISFDKAAEVAYHLDWTFAEAMVKQGHSVIVDSTCNYEQILSQGIALVQRYGYGYWYVEVKVDNVGMLDERLRESVPLRSQRTGVDCPPRDAGGARGSEDSRRHALYKRWIENPCRPDGHDIRTVVVNSTESTEKRP